jgi:hypothetical protein
MTGETTKHNLLFLQGLTAANGKTTMAKIFKSCLPIYCFNLSNETFYKKYQYFHKQAANLEAPVRFAYIEE